MKLLLLLLLLVLESESSCLCSLMRAVSCWRSIIIALAATFELLQQQSTRLFLLCAMYTRRRRRRSRLSISLGKRLKTTSVESTLHCAVLRYAALLPHHNYMLVWNWTELNGVELLWCWWWWWWGNVEQRVNKKIVSLKRRTPYIIELLESLYKRGWRKVR